MGSRLPSDEIHYTPAHRAIVTVGFYNLQFADEGDILSFLDDYVAGTGMGANPQSSIDNVASYRAGIFCDLIEQDLPPLKPIVDRAVRNEPFPDDELEFIHANCFPRLKNGKKSATCIIEYDTDIRSEFLRVVYRGILHLCGKDGPGIGRCQYEQCERVFSFGGPGPDRKYCRDSHRYKAFMERKTAI